MFDKKVSLKNILYEFRKKDSICEGFAGKYILSNLLIIAVPLAIVFITYVSKTILRMITAFEKR